MSRVSRHLSALEQWLQVRLRQRTTRQMHLTPEGVLFADHAREILAELRAAEENVTTAAADRCASARPCPSPCCT